MWLRRREALDMGQFTPHPAEGYLVGGAVRDTLLDRRVRDLDWLVPDPAGEARRAAEALGGRAFVLDAARGHWRVAAEGETRDYAPLDALEPNLKARDFTVNALAADLSGSLIDPTGGRRDLRMRTLRMVRRENLPEDSLRPLRGVRLAAELGFLVEPETEAAIGDHAGAQRRGEASLPAWERVGEELSRLLMTERAAQGVQLMHALGLLEVYLPELAEAGGVQQGGFHHLDVLGHSLEALHQLLLGFPEADLTLRWATLLHDLGKPATKSEGETGRFYHFYGHDKLGAQLSGVLLRRLRAPNGRVARASELVRYHMLPLPKNEREARRFVHRRRDLLPDLLKLMVADREAARGPLSSEASRRAYRTALSRILALLTEPPPRVPLLDGHEVMRLLNLPPGPEVGQAVRFLREAEAVGDVRSKADAEAALRRYAEGQGWLL